MLNFITLFQIELKKFFMTKTLRDSLLGIKVLISKPTMSQFMISRHPGIVWKP